MDWGELVAHLTENIPEFVRERKTVPQPPVLKGLSSEAINRILVDFLSFSVRNPPAVFSQNVLRLRENLAESMKEDNKRGWGHSIHPFEVVYLGDKKTERWKDQAVAEREALALAAHKAECGCEWPEHDFVFDVNGWIGKIFVDKMYDPGVVEMLSHFCQRGALLNHLDAAIKVCEFIESQHRNSLDLEPITRIGEILREIVLRKKNGTLNKQLFSDPSTWSFCLCGKGIPPDQMDRSRCSECCERSMSA